MFLFLWFTLFFLRLIRPRLFHGQLLFLFFSFGFIHRYCLLFYGLIKSHLFSISCFFLLIRFGFFKMGLFHMDYLGFFLFGLLHLDCLLLVFLFKLGRVLFHYLRFIFLKLFRRLLLFRLFKLRPFGMECLWFFLFRPLHLDCLLLVFLLKVSEVLLYDLWFIFLGLFLFLFEF